MKNISKILKSVFWEGETTTGVMWLMFLLGLLFGWGLFN